MSEEFLAQQPTAIWNSARGVWEIAGSQNLFCEHWELYQAVWPTSGMTVNGRLYELQTQAHRTIAPESSLLRSPKASEGEGGALGEAEARKRGNTVGVRDQVMDLVASQGEKVSRVSVLPTPMVSDQFNADLKSSQQKDGSLHSVTLAQIMHREDLLPFARELLPTPNTMEHREIKSKEQIAELKEKSPGGYRNLREEVVNEMLGTPRVRGTHHSASQVAKGAPKARVEDQVMTLLPTVTTQDGKNNAGPSQFDRNTKPLNVEAVMMSDLNWGKFEFAIRQWEAVLGRPAPAPTKPDGKDGAHRLSSEFTEWMMGLEPGWVTGCGLTRNEELKACGNGVVPQQAQLALRILLDGVSW